MTTTSPEPVVSASGGADELAERALRSLSAEPRPFLRWAGSKRALLHEFVDLIPVEYGTYWEPFLGAGSLFFLLQPENAVIGDKLVPLVDAYRAVAERVDLVLRYLAPLDVSRETYYRVRDNRGSSSYKLAAEFIFLNKTCWNGLYRVNAEGKFNVPYGAPKTGFVIDPSNLRACSRTLGQPGVKIRDGDFERILGSVKPGDLVFLDPPYVTGHNNNGFIDYNEVLFSWDDQRRLASVAKRLADLGASVIVTNASHQGVIDLYRGFAVRRISRWSTLASSAAKRGPVEEVVLWRSTHTRRGA